MRIRAPGIRYHVVTHRLGESDQWQGPYTTLQEAENIAKGLIGIGIFEVARIQASVSLTGGGAPGTVCLKTWRWGNLTEVVDCFRAAQGINPPLDPPGPYDEPDEPLP